MILDIGCGGSQPWHRKKGDIGLDLNRDSPYIDIRADAHHLPFRSAIFHKVVASHILEHLQDPVAGLTEIRRVLRTQGKLEAYVPNRYGERHPDPSHIHHWNMQEFRALLSQVFPSVKTWTGKACWIPLRGNRHLWGPYVVRLFPKLASELRANCSIRP